MAKKKATKKKVGKTIKEDIKTEEEISEEISDLEKKERKEEEFTKQLQGEVKKLDEEVATELEKPEKEMDEVPTTKKSSNKKNIIWGLIAALMIILSVLYFSGIIFPEEDLTQYNDFELRQSPQGHWEVKLTDDWMPFFYHPTEVDEIPVDSKAIQEISSSGLKNNEVILSLDPEAPDGLSMGQAIIEIQKVLTLPSFSIVTFSGAQYELEGYNHKIVNCGYKAENQTVVEFITIPENSIVYEDERCIKLNAEDPESFKMVADALAFRLLGVITN